MLLYDILSVIRNGINTVVNLRVYNGRIEKVKQRLAEKRDDEIIKPQNIVENHVEYCSKIYPGTINDKNLEKLLDDNVDLNISIVRDKINKEIKSLENKEK